MLKAHGLSVVQVRASSDEFWPGQLPGGLSPGHDPYVASNLNMVLKRLTQVEDAYLQVRQALLDQELKNASLTDRVGQIQLQLEHFAPATSVGGSNSELMEQAREKQRAEERLEL